jgi:hypothetical protein
MKRVLFFATAAALVVVPWAVAVPPTISVQLTGTSGDSGWYRSAVTITWLINTNGESIVSVTGCQNKTISTQGANPAETCSVVTSGGSASVGTAEIRIDSQNPTIGSPGLARAPDQAGWYNAPVAFAATASDPSPGSGLPAGACSGAYSGPDSGSASGTITCRDVAGNGSAAPVSGFKYDNTPPAITGAAPARTPDANGWYNHAVSVSFTATDNLSGLGGCATVSYGGPDGAGASVPSSCVDVAGNPSTGSATINYDATPPGVGASPERGPDSNGWYSRPVAVGIGGSDATSGLAGCSGGGTYSGPEGVGSVSGTCSDKAGNVGGGAVEIRYDSRPPEVRALVTARPPDAAGWFNHPIDVTFEGVDGGSGIAGCSKTTYAGPDARGAELSGTCTDRAGHTSPAKSFTLKYDATPPSLTDVVAQVGNKFALLKWKASSDVASVRVSRSPGRNAEPQTVVYSGIGDFYKDTGIDNRTRYEYRVTAADEAANATPEALATAVPLPALYSPAAGARVRAPIVFEWLSIPRAAYYNVQVWCGRRKVLTAWPKRPRLVLPVRGKLAGRTYALPLGACRWYVWPGFGRFVEKRYGRLAGSSTFVRRR